MKDFIVHICDWVEHEYKNKRHDAFSYYLRDDKMSYLIADKAIEKRIEKRLFKRLRLRAKVKYTLSPSIYKYLDGTIRIKLIQEYKRPYSEIYIPDGLFK